MRAKSLICIPADCLLGLRELVDYEALGVAVCLMERQYRNGEGLKDDRGTARALGLQAARWKRLREQLLPHFDLSRGVWAHPRITHILEQARAEGGLPAAPRPPARASAPAEDLPLFTAAAAPEAKAPAVEARAPTPRPRPPAGTTIGSQVVQMGVHLFAETGVSEDRARQMMGLLLKEYDVGFIAGALNDALRRQDEIANPLGWLRTRLREYPTRKEQVAKRQQRNSPPKVTGNPVAHPEVSPDLLGVSKETADRLRDRSAKAARRGRFSFSDAAD